MSAQTPSQTVGPFFAIGLHDHPCPEGPVHLTGRVLDGAGAPVPDAAIEIWSPEAGWGRAATDADGRYEFRLRPTPSVDAMVFARGLIKQVRTRIYFDPEADDPVIAGLPDRDRATLIAQRDGDGFRFDVHLQGDRQTAFFAV